MSESLESRLKRIRGRLKQALCLYGISWVVAVILGATLGIGFLDWLVHFDDSGVRLILGLGIAGGGLCVAWRCLVAPLLVKLSDVDIALRIERRHPAFNDSLASSVQFLDQQTDPRLGSPALQRQVIQRTMERIDQVDVDDVIEIRSVRRIAGTAILICLVTALVVGLNRVEAATALNRLLFPFAANAWPKQTELRLLDAEFRPLASTQQQTMRMARGDTLELFVENRIGGLPEKVKMLYDFGDGEVVSETLRKTTLRDETGTAREVAVSRLTVVRGPVRFRAVGGDDDEMPWRRLQVVPPPLIDKLQIKLTPPPYSRRAAEQLPQGVGHLQGLVGTKVQIRAHVNKRLKSAALHVKDKPAVPIELAENARAFSAEFVIEESGVYSYWFDMQDRQGFENSEAPRYEIRAVADLEPKVFIERPAGDMQVTVDAQVELRVVAKDDLGLNEIRLQYVTGESESGDEHATLIPLFPTDSNDFGDERLQQRTVEHVWQLAPLKLKGGDRIVYHAEATDDYDLGPQHVGRSVARTLTVVSSEEKAAELAARQADLLGNLQRIQKNQANAHERVGELQLQLSKVGKLRPEDIDLLKRIELEQRQITSQLLNPADGIETLADELLAELKNNRIDDDGMRQQLQQIAGELAVLRGEHLPAIEQNLTKARKSAQANASKRNGKSAEQRKTAKSAPASNRKRETGADPSRKNADSKKTPQEKQPVTGQRNGGKPLDEARDNQAAVLESLDVMLGMLSEWQLQQNLTGDLGELIAWQKELNADSADVEKQTLSKPLGALTKQEQADLARLSARQRQQAQRLAKLGQKLSKTAENIAEQDPDTAAAVSDARDALEQGALSGRMSEAADNLEKNRIGQATSDQRQILDDLNELQDMLRNRSPSDVETLVKKLKQAEDDLEKLVREQEELLKKVRDQQDNPDAGQRSEELQKLQKKQAEVRERLKRLSRQLRRLQAFRSRESAERAADRMQQAEESLQQGANEQSADEQQEALDDLQQTQRELAQSRQEAEEQLAREMLERIADELKSMIERQQVVVDETARLEALRKQRGNWSRGQLKSLRQLVETQQGLQQETDDLVETVESAAVFALALKGASRLMETAANRLSDRKADEETLAAERAAKQRFVDLIAALKTDKSNGQSSQNANGGGGGSGNDGPQSDAIPQLAQLKMLKTLQEDVITRTQRLNEVRQNNGELTEEQSAELAELADEQGQLADLTRNLTEAVMQAIQAEKYEEESNDTENPDAETSPDLNPEP